MRFTRLSASIKTTSVMALQCMSFTHLSASIKTTSVFFFVSRYNACVSHACLNRFRRLLRFSWYGVTMHVFHTRFCIGKDDFCVFLGMALHCMCFTRVSASVKTIFAFSLEWRQSTCFSHASLHLLIWLSRFSWYGVTMHALTASIKT